MSTEFKIKEVFKKTFGYEPPAKFEIPQASSKTTTSKLGQPLFMDDVFGREFFMPLQFTGTVKAGSLVVPFNYLVPFAVVGISCKKTIVSTPLVERQGSVKELINVEDYIFNIKGIIVRPDDEWPEDEISDLERIFKINQSLVLRSALTDIFLKGDYEHRVVIHNVKLPPTPGIQHSASFEMDCESDAIFTLELE